MAISSGPYQKLGSVGALLPWDRDMADSLKCFPPYMCVCYLTEFGRSESNGVGNPYLFGHCHRTRFRVSFCSASVFEMIVYLLTYLLKLGALGASG